jgi:hypothetical protein
MDSSSSRLLVEALPSAATVLVAIITGFGAAALKHRWDSQAADKRWHREGADRLRRQRLDAFAHYLSARPDLGAVRDLPDRSPDLALTVSAARLAAASLLILLSKESQRAVVEADLRNVEDWVRSWSLPSRAGRTDVPSAQPILELARSLLEDSGEI